ncbi:hypothetical protein ASF90_16755 [Xanthomonas sp. Leaf148]|nr:hypothetical protein ASF90_16755 [Xanthomonas sp. Leaf148]
MASATDDNDYGTTKRARPVLGAAGSTRTHLFMRSAQIRLSATRCTSWRSSHDAPVACAPRMSGRIALLVQVQVQVQVQVRIACRHVAIPAHSQVSN